METKVDMSKIQKEQMKKDAAQKQKVQTRAVVEDDFFEA
jgi:hypothetical protein